MRKLRKTKINSKQPIHKVCLFKQLVGTRHVFDKLNFLILSSISPNNSLN